MARAKRHFIPGQIWHTPVERGEHLLRCIVYIDSNMIRAGVARHPSEWSFCGYKEIQNPHRKCALIASERLRELAGFATYDELRSPHRQWVEESLSDGCNRRDEKWSGSVAVGSERFVEKIKKELGIKGKGRKVIEAGPVYQLREPGVSYRADLGPKNDAIGGKTG